MTFAPLVVRVDSRPKNMKVYMSDINNQHLCVAVVCRCDSGEKLDRADEDAIYMTTEVLSQPYAAAEATQNAHG